MIFDQVSRLATYRSLGPHLARAIDWLTATDVAALDVGRYDVAGTDVFAMVQTYETKPADQAKWETHRRYVDIQLMLDGVERMDVVDADGLTVQTPYDDARDATFYASPETFLPVVVRPKQFAIFFPHDAHRPTVMAEGPMTIRKIVVKVAVAG